MIGHAPVIADSVLIGSLAVSLAVFSATVSWLLSFGSAWLAGRSGALDQPTGGRKIHARATPLWGGVGIAATLFVVCWVASVFGLLHIEILPLQVAGYLVGVCMLLIGGVIDDIRPLPPRVQILFPVLAALAVIVTGTGIIQVTNPLSQGAYSLAWGRWEWVLSGHLLRVTLPSDLLTFVWLIVATYAMKILDGLDGLVTGMTVISAGIVGALSLSLAYFQPSVGLLAAIIGGAYLGFLPRNVHPAKQFLGEAGSTIAGFSLGVLTILSSAKIAIALSVLAIPIADVAIVILGRMRRGVPWFSGDDTHLHFRLLKAGLTQRAAVWLYWGIALLAGVIALSLQTRGKLFLIATLFVLAVIGSYLAGLRASRVKSK